MNESNHDQSGKTLVLGAAIGYGAEDVRPFLSSLRNSGYRGDIALIADLRFMDARHPLLANVILVPATRWAFGIGSRLRKTRAGQLFVLNPWQWVCWLLLKMMDLLPINAGQRKRYRLAWAEWFYHPQLSRFFHYQRFIRLHDYQRVLLSDVRDVIFQADPFQHLPQKGLGVGMEAIHYTLSSQSWNATWVRTAYGDKALKQIGMNPVSCSGVTYGDRAAITHYVDLMVDEILGLGFHAVCQAGDQGMHNFLLWTGELGQVTRLVSLGSAVATLHDIDAHSLTFNTDGKLLNSDGSIVSIVHMYDRLPGVSERLLRANVG